MNPEKPKTDKRESIGEAPTNRLESTNRLEPSIRREEPPIQQGEEAIERPPQSEEAKEHEENPHLGFVTESIQSVEVGIPQRYQNMTVLPLIGRGEETGPEYLTLKEALEEKSLEVTEIDEGGSVPELRVRNLSDQRVLLLDGEELMGAKQNRVLNTTVMVAGQTEVLIPVSCTEQGRWSYRSQKFQDSEVMMTNKIRALKSRSVSASLKSMDSYQSNQSLVWHSIDALCESSGSYSHTSAMKAAYQQTAGSLAGYRDAFPMLPNQRGVVVYLNGRVAGSELVSRSKAYAQLHDKLLDSFSLDAVVEHQEQESTEISKENAESFLGEIPSWHTESFKSVGLGEDLRMENHDRHGNALLVEDMLVHTATFNHDSSQMEL